MGIRFPGLSKQGKGKTGEQLACDYLQSRGLKLLSRNYTSRFGEIDLVMQDGDAVVFVEVRYRKNRSFGGAAVSVTPQKQQRIIKTALYYLQQLSVNQSARFDVVAIEGQGDINWIPDAFQV
jgi:putative endonuclease